MIEKFPGKWLVACSGGIDSMALLSMCQKASLDIIVVTINYHMREDSILDVGVVRHFCNQHELKHIVIDSIPLTDNFQQSAREFRYKVFASLSTLHQCEGVLVAHHQDDSLETYLWQKQRKHHVVDYGIARQTILYHVNVCRPLIATSKQKLLDYVHQHEVPYREDSTNKLDKYTRNKIRKQVTTLSHHERLALIKEIEDANHSQQIMNQAAKKLSENITLDCDELFSLDKHMRQTVLLMWIQSHTKHQDISSKLIDEYLELLSRKKFKQIKLSNDTVISINANKATIETCISYDYQVKLMSIKSVKTPWFSLVDQTNSGFKLTLSTEEFPITIRNVQSRDRLKAKTGTKKVFDWFTDKKISHCQRATWPVIINAKNKLIGVFDWSIDINHSTNNPIGFMIK